MPDDLDAYDRRLLTLVQEDAGRTADQLADLVPLSVSAIQRRLKRLREDGVIEREVAVVDPRRVGAGSLFIAALRLAKEAPDEVARLRTWLAACPQVQQAYYVTGEDDFLVIACVRDVPAYEALMAGLMAAHPIVERYTTRVVLQPVKRGLSVPVEGG